MEVLQCDRERVNQLISISTSRSCVLFLPLQRNAQSVLSDPSSWRRIPWTLDNVFYPDKIRGKGESYKKPNLYPVLLCTSSVLDGGGYEMRERYNVCFTSCAFIDWVQRRKNNMYIYTQAVLRRNRQTWTKLKIIDRLSFVFVIWIKISFAWLIKVIHMFSLYFSFWVVWNQGCTWMESIWMPNCSQNVLLYISYVWQYLV